MHRTTLPAVTLAALLAGATSFAMAQNSPPPASVANAGAVAAHTMSRSHAGAMARPLHNQWSQGANRGRSGVISDLRSQERQYMEAGPTKDMTAVYNDLQARSQDPRVRNYVYHRLARLQARPANVDQAIATLRKSLDENLANAAKMRSEREQMRSRWQQQHQGAGTPATSTGPTL
jgi:predicted negative regulator of RcsB-dependent stress response